MRPSDPIIVNAQQGDPSANSGGGFSPQDIAYALFRHKWKIILLTLLGLGAAAGFYLATKPVFVSEARLLIRYVIENRAWAPDEPGTVRSPDARGDTIINSELQMLTSFDLAQNVVRRLGPTNIVRDSSPGLAKWQFWKKQPAKPDPLDAALRSVRQGLEVGVLPRSSVVFIRYRHEDPVVARAVVTNLVDAYLDMHARVHRSQALTEIQAQVDRRRSELASLESQLRDIMNTLGIVDLEEAKTASLKQIASVQAEILTTEAQLAERMAALNILTNAAALAAAASGPPAAALSPTNLPPADIVREHGNVVAQIERLTAQEQELSLRFRDPSPFLRAVQGLLSEKQQRRAALEREYPSLVLGAAAQGGPSTANQGQGGPDLNAAAINIQMLRAKYSTLTNQLANLEANAKRISEREGEIRNLKHRIDIVTQQLTDASIEADKANISQQLTQEKIGNIKTLESATPAYPDYGKRVKTAGMLAGGGLALGLAIAIFMEMFLDQSMRRPAQVERNLRLPLFLSIPRLRLKNGAGRPALPAPANGSPAPSSNGVAKADEMTAFAEALRDRLMMHFQLHGLNHKPKLVGVTSCGHGAGVTTIATRLAASLSETGDGNVLYVDVNQDRGPSAHPFKHGEAVVGIRDALEQDTRDAAKVQENLYMVSLADPASGRVGVVPKTLSGLVPRMKASDYDYIIFDLPPITQTSATSKVAGLLDMTFVVLDSEKTQTDLARKATNLLAESRANVAAVLNKHRRYLPKKLDTDL